MSNKSCTLALFERTDAALAQLVEQRTENPCVPSSILGGGTAKLLGNRELLLYMQNTFIMTSSNLAEHKAYYILPELYYVNYVDYKTSV